MFDAEVHWHVHESLEPDGERVLRFSVSSAGRARRLALFSGIAGRFTRFSYCWSYPPESHAARGVCVDTVYRKARRSAVTVAC